MSQADRHFWRPLRRRRRTTINVDVADDPAVITASAVSLSTSALFTALMMHLQQKDVVSAQDHVAIYDIAVTLLETDPADDGGITDMAREVIEQQLRLARAADQ